MLSYLVSSVARRALLALLWTERLEASVSELARLGRVSNTAAQRELGLMREAGLACVRSVGSAHLYRANVDHPQAAVLESLLAPASPARARSPKNERLLAWLNYLGAPFWEPPPLPPPSREAALAAGVAAAKLDASLARALPVVFWKQRASLDWKELGYAAARVGVKHELGFFVDMAGVLAGSTGLRRRARLFRDRRRTTPRAFFSWPGAITRPFLEEESPPLAKRWGLLMDVGHDSFESHFKKHAFSDCSPTLHDRGECPHSRSSRARHARERHRSLSRRNVGTIAREQVAHARLELRMSERQRLLGLDDRALEMECEVDRYRASGPGGQKRNKTESAVRVRHLGMGVTAFADDSRSQHANRQRALARLREKLALVAREPVPMADGVYLVPEALGKLVSQAGKATRRERIAAEHLVGLAELLDLFAACEGVVADLALALGSTTAVASKLLTTEERVLRAANELRAVRGLNALKA